MGWLYKELVNWITKGCSVPSYITNLNISHNNLQVIPPEISKLENIEYFDCSHNEIESIFNEIYKLQNLYNFIISYNRLQYLPPQITYLSFLHTLLLSHNNFKTFPIEITNLPALEVLYIHNNQITIIPPEIRRLEMLNTFYIHNNLIEELPPEIGQLRSLRIFYISNNRLMTIPPELCNCLHLTNFYYIGNPIDYMPPNVFRFIQDKTLYNGVYNDAQSVHKSSIQQSVKKSIEAILSHKPKYDNVNEMIINDSTLTSHTKESLLEYSTDKDVHSVLQITFGELLVAVWNRIVVNDHCTEIKKILNQEMSDAECKCFTGRMARLINCLNGFDSDVDIKISDNEQIGTVISVVREQLEIKNEYTIEKHKSIATKRLEELGYSQQTIQSWIDFIA